MSVFGSLYERIVCHFGGNEARINISRKKGVKIGSGCLIGDMPIWGSEPYLIELGDNVKITSGVKFVNHDGGVHVLRNEWSDKHAALPEADIFGIIKIGNNVFIGIGVTIMPGVTIGDNVIIGAGSIVTRDIPSNSVAAGIPAKVIRTIEEYYEKNNTKILMTKNLNANEKEKELKKIFNINKE